MTQPGTGEPASYEQARDELLEVVRRLEAGGTTLEESLALWERGEALADACQRWLDGARERLRTVTDQRAGGGDSAPASSASSGYEAVPATTTTEPSTGATSAR